MKLENFRSIVLQSEDFKQEYKKFDLAFEIGQMIVEARILKGFTQQKLAKLVNTKKSTIVQLENGQQLPSPNLYKKILNALDIDISFPILIQEQL